MTSSRSRIRHQQKVEELCAAAIRSLTGERDLHIHGRRLHKGKRPLALHAPHLLLSEQIDDFTSWRGAMDSVALKRRHSNALLHRSLCPREPVARLVFEMLEQLRVESLAPDSMPGVTSNIRHRFRMWSLAFHRAGMMDGAIGLLIYTVFQVCWSHLTGQAPLEETEDVMEATRAGIASSIGSSLHSLRRTRHNQAEYARHALAIAGIVGEMIRAAKRDQARDDRTGDKDDALRDALGLLIDFDGEGADKPLAIAATGRSRVLQEAEHGYRAFTREYDCVVDSGSLVRPELLRELRERLDLRVRQQGVNIAALSRKLMALLAEPQRDGWSYGQEEGYIDGRRLAQLVSSPAERRLFRLEQYKPRADCMISFLVDCSGSMKQHAESVAMLIDILARALEAAGVATEILGFTTGAWNGGRPYRDWIRQGRPKNPGRLNALCHMVFKDAGTTWRRARPGIAALLKADLFREGVDGEALDWACDRMRARSEKRRILIVFSDGSPTDSATNLANDAFYLDNHLKEVVARRTAGAGIEIHGLGVGLDLSPYYERHLALDFSGSLGNTLFTDIMQLIAGGRRR
jgi:cobaltochelatase CobT